MAIYDNNGTTSVEISKVYDNDGTTNHQIGKVYDNDGTTDSLIYTAEEIIIDASKGLIANDWATGLRGTGGKKTISKTGGTVYHSTNDKTNNCWWKLNTSTGIEVKCVNDYMGIYESISRDFSQYSKITFHITNRSGSHDKATAVGVGYKSGIYYNKDTSSWFEKGIIVSATGEYTIDLTDCNFSGAIGLACSYDATIKCDKIILE